MLRVLPRYIITGQTTWFHFNHIFSIACLMEKQTSSILLKMLLCKKQLNYLLRCDWKHSFITSLSFTAPRPMLEWLSPESNLAQPFQILLFLFFHFPTYCEYMPSLPAPSALHSSGSGFPHSQNDFRFLIIEVPLPIWKFQVMLA